MVYTAYRDETPVLSGGQRIEGWQKERNIVYFTEGAVWTGSWHENRAVIRDNLYFDPGRKVLDFGGITFRQWQARGLDVGSRISDPKFVDPDGYDFHLRKDSPAFKLGFVAFDLSDVGPRPEFAPRGSSPRFPSGKQKIPNTGKQEGSGYDQP